MNFLRNSFLAVLVYVSLGNSLPIASQAPFFTQNKAGGGGSGPCTPSYANNGGTGDRRSIITVSFTLSPDNLMSGGDGTTLVDGDTTSNGRIFWNVDALDGSTYWLKFDFGSGNAVIINEIKYYQQDTTAEGTWQVQGSNDNSTWTSIGSTFPLGGVATQTITTPSANTTAYRYYRLLGISGTTDNTPWVYQFEFKICGI